SFRTLKSPDQALEAGRGALRLPPDHSYPLHRLWVAFEEAARGDLASGRAALEEIAADSLNSWYQSLRQLLRAVVESSGAGLKAALQATPALGQEPALFLAYRQALRRIRASQGIFKGFWTWLRHAR